MSSVFRNSAILVRRGARLMQSRNYADEAMKLTFAAANKVFYDKVEVKQVDVPSFSGDFGILAAHVPTLGLLFILYTQKAMCLVNRCSIYSCTQTWCGYRL